MKRYTTRCGEGTLFVTEPLDIELILRGTPAARNELNIPSSQQLCLCRVTQTKPRRQLALFTMHSATLASLGFLGLQLSDVAGFHVPVPVQTRNMRSTGPAMMAVEGTSKCRLFCWVRSKHLAARPCVCGRHEDRYSLARPCC